MGKRKIHRKGGNRKRRGGYIMSKSLISRDRKAVPRDLMNKFSHDVFPLNFWTMFTYSNVHEITTGTAGAVSVGVTYQLNSLYAPQSSGGHSAWGLNKLLTSTGPYLRYKVYAAKVTVEFTDPSADAGLYCVVNLRNPSNTYSVDTQIFAQVAEKGGVWTDYLQSGGEQRKVFTRYIPMYKAFEVTKKQFNMDLDNTTAGYGGSPGSLVKLEIGLGDTRASAGITCHARVSVQYYVQCYQRFTFAQS